MRGGEEDSDLWDGYMGAIPFDEFMEDVESTVEEAIKEEMFIMEDCDLDKDEKEYIQERLIAHINKNAQYWAEKKDSFFKCSAEEIMKSKLPLTSGFDDSIRDSDFRVLRTKYYDKVGNKTSESFDLQCYGMLLWDAEPYWESIIDYNRHRKHHQISHIQRTIRNLAKDYQD